MASSISRRVFRAIGSADASSRSFSLYNALQGHDCGGSSNWTGSAIIRKASFDFCRRYSTAILTTNSRNYEWAGKHAMVHLSPFHLSVRLGQHISHSCFARSLASQTGSESKKSETRKDVSTVEDPFDSPTYNIPEKPVTFTEGASYSLVILAGLGIAGAAAYGICKELIFEPKEYKIFNKTLERVQNDGQVRVRIGSPITGYGSESRNRAARQRVPHKTWTDDDGNEHVLVNFHIRGPHGAGKVYSEMFKDKVDKEWKYTYLIVEVTSPSPAQLMLESYIPV